MSNMQCWENVGFQYKTYIIYRLPADVISYLYRKWVPISGNNGFKFKHPVGEQFSYFLVLMEEILYQMSLVVSSIIYRFFTSKRWWNSEPSTV